MSFRLREDSKKWFKRICKAISGHDSAIETLFDIYYFCLLLGLAAGRRSNPTDSGDAPVFIDSFIDAYRPSKNMIIALLVRAELSRLGVTISERDEVRKKFIDLIDDNTPTNLTTEGMKHLNAYASGGYDYLAERIEEEPYTAEEFLQNYVPLLQKAVEESDKW